MNAIWKEILHNGIQEDQNEFKQAYSSKLKHVLLFSLFTLILFSIAFLFFTIHSLLLLSLASIAILLIALKLNKNEKVEGSRTLYILTTNLFIFLFCDIAGKDSGAYFLFFCVQASVFSNFNRSKALILYILIPPALWLFLETQNYDVFFYENTIESYQLTTFQYISGVSTFLLSSIFLYKFFYQKALIDNKLKKTLVELKVTKEESEKRLQESIKTQELLSENKHIIQEEKDNAIKALKIKSDFLSSIGHEIRTPMNVVVGITDLLVATETDEEKLSNLNLIKKSSDNLLIIVNDLLDFSKLERGKMSIEEVEFNLETKVNDVLKALKLELERKNNTLNLTFDPKINPLIISDPTRIGQVILNLVSNANKFTENGEINVDVKLQNSEGKSFQRFLFSISDTGIGIKQSSLQDIFNSFSQASTSTSRRYGGTGLGLPICKHIIEALKGKIWAESVHGEGSQFHFEISTSTFSLNTKKCLVIENQEINQLVISNSLRLLNYSPVFQKSIDYFKESYNENEYDLILINGDNFSVEKYLKSLKTLHLNHVTSLVYSSNRRQTAKKLEGIEAIKATLPLPFSPKELSKVIE